jgi:hypothetical protein
MDKRRRMKRFDIDYSGVAWPEDDGDWVEYDEAAAEIERLKGVICKARLELHHWEPNVIDAYSILEAEINSWEEGEDDES